MNKNDSVDHQKKPNRESEDVSLGILLIALVVVVAYTVMHFFGWSSLPGTTMGMVGP